MQRISNFVRHNLVASIALFFALSGGVAWATHPGGANTINSADIIDGQVKELDVGQGAIASNEVKNDSIVAGDVAPSSLTSARIADGSLTGTDVANNSIKGADVDESTLDIGDAARAYAAVFPSDCNVLNVCSPEQSKGISSVTRTGIGSYCVIAPGISSAVTPAAVTVEFSDTEDPEGDASAITHEGFDCGPNNEGFTVITDRQPVTSSTTVGPAEPANDVAFTIVIP
jgi:hypothetical protein